MFVIILWCATCLVANLGGSSPINFGSSATQKATLKKVNRGDELLVSYNQRHQWRKIRALVHETVPPILVLGDVVAISGRTSSSLALISENAKFKHCTDEVQPHCNIYRGITIFTNGAELTITTPIRVNYNGEDGILAAIKYWPSAQTHEPMLLVKGEWVSKPRGTKGLRKIGGPALTSSVLESLEAHLKMKAQEVTKKPSKDDELMKLRKYVVELEGRVQELEDELLLERRKRCHDDI